MNSSQHHQTAYLYVIDTLADWEVGFITAELNSGRYLGAPGTTALKTVAAGLEPIHTMGGISITPDLRIDDVDFGEADILILPGADTWDDDAHAGVLQRVPELLARNVAVAAICGATVALAQTGTLDDRRHTSNDKGFLKMVCPAYRGEALYTDAPVVVDGTLITASGLAPLEFAREVFGIMNAMTPDVLATWYELYRTQDPQHFHALMAAIDPE